MVDANTCASLGVEQIWQVCDDLTAAHGDLMPASLRAPVPL
jgi:alpha-galactosidase